MSSSRDVRSNAMTSPARRSWFFSRNPRASYSTCNQARGITDWV